jgi:hypothetical protein
MSLCCRVMLRDDAQPLWDSLFEHLIQLVTCKVMTPNEVAAVFVPCMVSDKSPYQDKVCLQGNSRGCVCCLVLCLQEVRLCWLRESMEKTNLKTFTKPEKLIRDKKFVKLLQFYKWDVQSHECRSKIWRIFLEISMFHKSFLSHDLWYIKNKVRFCT